jgi:solute carrier family 13 (sodium-dependent dicarboxylate transporter), member 2/3/5
VTSLDSRREARRLLGKLEVSTWRPLGLTCLCVAGAWLGALYPEHPDLDPAARWALFILVLAAGLWVTEAIPAYAVAVLVIGLEIAILGREGGVFATDEHTWKIFIEPWGSPLIWLFFGGFVLARGIQSSGLDRWFSAKVLKRFGARPSRVLLGSMVVTFGFSMFASNTATSAMMIAVLSPVVASFHEDRFAKALLLGVPFAANIGGMATLIGTPPNAIAAGSLADVEPIGFARWMGIGLPPAVCLLLVAWRFLLRRYPATTKAVDLGVLDAATADERLPAWRRLVVLVTFMATVGMWLTEPLHGVPTPVVAFIPVTMFTVTSVLRSEDIRTLQWDVLLLLAGGLALGVGVSETGLADWLVEKLPTRGATPLVLGAVLAVTAMIMSNFMSNTAAANVIIPMGLALAAGNEALVVVPIAFGASLAMCLPVSTPPNAIAYATGDLEGRDFLLGGALIGVVGVALSLGWSQVALRWLL